VQLLFTGHMDTVYGLDHPFQTVGWREDGTLGGPGVADMKGGIAVMLAALKAAEASEAAQGFGYEVVINSDEEVGSPGSAALIAEAARGKRAAFTYEPAALPNGTLAGARPGSGNFSILVEGRSAHAGRNPEEGRNAIVAAADLTLRLAEMKGTHPVGQPGADRRRRSQQCRPRPGGAAHKYAPPHRRRPAAGAGGSRRSGCGGRRRA
jgi:glutamate carboxypeptidase